MSLLDDIIDPSHAYVFRALDQRDPFSTGGQHGRKSAQSGAQNELPVEDFTQPAPGLQEPALPSRVTCRARYYDAASRILEDELHLFTHENANELGAYIQKWMERKHDNWEPR